MAPYCSDNCSVLLAQQHAKLANFEAYLDRSSVASCFGDLSDMLRQGLKADCGIFPSSLDRQRQELKRVLMNSTSRTMRATMLHHSSAKQSYDSTVNQRTDRSSIVQRLPVRPSTVGSNRAYSGRSSSLRRSATSATAVKALEEAVQKRNTISRNRPHASHAGVRADVHDSTTVYVAVEQQVGHATIAAAAAIAGTIESVHSVRLVQAPAAYSCETKSVNSDKSLTAAQTVTSSRQTAREQLALLQQRQMIALTAVTSAVTATVWHRAWLSCEAKLWIAQQCCV
eukprot:14966-Heterococcus_DN1.PRE.5